MDNQGTSLSNAPRPLTLLAANQRIQASPQPFQLMKLPAELRIQVYRELLIGREQTIVVSAVSSIRSRSRKLDQQWPDIYRKDITIGLLRTSRHIYNEALAVLYQSHVFDFGIDVHNMAPFFDQISSAGRQHVHRIHMELLRYGTIDGAVRSVPGIYRNYRKDNCQDWSSACAYIASHLQVKELSFNINCIIHHEFQRISWVRDLAQIHGLQAVYHEDSPHENCLKSSEASVMLANQMSSKNWGTDEYRWEVLLQYLRSKMLH